MQDVLAPPAPERGPGRPERVDLYLVARVGPLATEATVQDFALWEQELTGTNTLDPSGNSVAETAGPNMDEGVPAQEFAPGAFPEPDEPYGEGTVSQAGYHRQLNWRADMAGQLLDQRARGSSGPNASQLAKLKAAVRRAKENRDPYSQIDEVKAVEDQVSNFLQRPGAD